MPALAYVFSVSHEPGSWDTAELQGVPYVLGISHPTGFPLFVLLGFVWSHAVALDTVAFRMNAFCATIVAATAAAAYAVARELGAARSVSLAITLWFAATTDVWSHAVRAEAQDLAVLCQALALWAFLAWMRGGPQRLYVAAFALWGLALAAHPNALWLFPALAIGTLVARRRPSLRLGAAAAACVVAALALYLYLPLRSAGIVAHGLDPTHGLAGVNGGIFWNYGNPSTPRNLVRYLTGSDFGTPHYLLAALNPLRIGDAAWAFVGNLREQFGALVVLGALGGAACAWRRDWRTTLVLCVACTTALLFAVSYGNEGDLGRYELLALLLAVPLVASLPSQRPRDFNAQVAAAAVAAVCFAGAALAFSSHRSFFAHRAGEGGRWVIAAVAPFVPQGAVIVAPWLDATSLAYGAYVDGSLKNRIVVSNWSLHDAALYRLWARRYRVFVLSTPVEVEAVPHARAVATLDDYHELVEVRP